MVSDTIFALSSGRAPAAISVIRVSGSEAHGAGLRLAGSLPGAREAGVRELRHPGSCELLDRALVLRFDAPASSTGEDTVEFHCHGGRAVVQGVLDTLATIPGLRQAEPGEFTRRAFENGRIDLTEAEGLADLIEAETESQRRAALMMAQGGLRAQIEQWRQRLVDLSARAEAAIDYVDEESVGGDHQIGFDCGALARELGEWLERPRAEPLRDGLRVVIAGPPNAGKSSLLNAIVDEERAIVSDVPGTTRDHIDVALSLAGIPVRLTDTAGLRDSPDMIESAGVHRARALVGAADVVLWMGDPSEAPHRPGVIRVHGRSDAEGREDAPPGFIAVSSKTGEGLPQLTDTLIELARRLLPAEDQVALNQRQASCVLEARAALIEAGAVEDLAITADALRQARSAFDRLTGRAGVEDVLDSLFGRFCLGK